MTRVAVVGGGYAGTAQAILLARAGLPVTLIERASEPGRGAAYGTDRPEHLLNVRAGSMSAFADDPAHFAGWFEGQGGTAADFAPRRLYGRYVQEQLAGAANGIKHVRGEAIDVAENGVRFADGTLVAADAVILAIGNLPPASPRLIPAEIRDSNVYVADPWAGEVGADLADDDTVLLLGTGLTAVDTVLTLDARGFQGRIVAASRRGLRPRAHAATGPAVAGLTEPPTPRCTMLLASVRKSAGELGWRAAVDRLRPVTQALWASAPIAERRRFLRHLRPWWDVHRHRIAPQVSERLDALVAEGRLEFMAAKLESVALGEHGAEVRLRRRGQDETDQLTAQRIVNCTGPQADIRRARQPLLNALLAAGRIRPDPLGIGIDVDRDSRVVGADGAASNRLFAIGPMTRGAYWEIVAVPDIRNQVQAVAELLVRSRS